MIGPRSCRFSGNYGPALAFALSSREEQATKFKMSRVRTVVNIAGAVFALYSEYPDGSILAEAPLQDFLSEEEPVVSLFVRHSGLTQLDCSEESKIFESEAYWRLHKLKQWTVLVVGQRSEQPSQIIMIDKNFRKIDVLVNQSIPLPSSESFLLGTLGQVLMVCLLARGRGIMTHACGIDHHGKGYLFLGNSGHGKSTMAALWTRRGIILNDDRIVVRYKKGRFWIFGTPWHGDHTQVSGGGAPLDKVFFLHHSNQHSVVPVVGASAVSMILTRSFPPVWDEKGLSFTLDFIARLADAVPCFSLGFVPEISVLEFIKCLK
jgi:hypothetical protein